MRTRSHRPPTGSVGILLAAACALSHPARADAACDPSALCSAGPCTISGTHALEDGCVLDFGALGVTTLTIEGTLTTTSAGQALTVRAPSLAGAGTLSAPGGRLTVESTSTSGALTWAGVLDVRPGGTAIVYGTGPVALSGEVAADGTTAPDAGSIEISGATVEVGGSLHATGGANGRGGRLSVTTRTGSLTTTAASTLTANGGSAGQDGGIIEVLAATILTLHGSVAADGAGSGAGGTIRLTAEGTCTASHTIHARATGTADAADGGEIALRATGATITGALRASALGTGSGGTIRVKLTAGDFTMPSGTIDVGSGAGGRAGTFDLASPADVTLGGTVLANASGATSRGGAITVQAGDVVTVTGPLEAHSTTAGGTQEEAFIELSGCTLDIRAPIQARSGGGSGQTRFYYTQAMIIADTSVLADDLGGTRVGCACHDANGDGACETPRTCRADPVVTNATTTPAIDVHPEYPTVCG